MRVTRTLVAALAPACAAAAIAVAMLPGLARVQAQAPPWPAGVPRPSFGLDEQPGAITATIMPGQAMPNPIPAGAVVQLGPGTHSVSNRTWTSAGTAAQPVFVVAAPGAVITGASGWKLSGQHLILDGLTVVDAKVMVNAHHVAIRSTDFSDLRQTSNTAVIGFGLGSGDAVLYRNEFHGNGGETTNESDIHAVKAGTASAIKGLWLIENVSDGNNGDSFQCGDATGADPWPKGIYVIGNTFRNEGENGVDIKRCEDVAIVGNEISGMRASSSDPGRAIILHNGARNVRVSGNFLHHNQGEGIASTGSSFEADLNQIEDNGIGVRAYSSTGTVHHNTFRRNGTALILSGGVTAADNVIEGGPSPTPTPTPSPTATPSPVPTPTPSPSPSAPPALTCTLTFTVVNGRLVAGPCQ